MKHLSNADLRILYQRRLFLQQFIQVTVRQTQNNIDCLRSSTRIKAIWKEVKEIVDDPQFGVLVMQPEVTRSAGEYDEGAVLIKDTMASVASTANELLLYIDGVLSIYLTPKSKELAANPTKIAKVFIGHGRNEIVRGKVKDFIRDRCKVEPLVLQELPGSGLTVIEKLEKYGRTADYAVLILTGDDIMQGTEYLRARQNVIQELGWFQGVLGRNRTAILVQKGVEIASNIAGVMYLEFTSNSVEMIFEALRKEFEEAGIIERALS
jgi:predicted nucleotide-binding protein